MKHILLSFVTLFLTVNAVLSQQWATNGTNIYNTNTGNVGIGTSTPSAPLHNAGRLSGGASFKIGLPNTSGNITVPIGSSTGAYDIDFYGWRDIQPTQIGARIRADRINNYQDNNALLQSMDLAFFTSTGIVGDLAEKLRIKSDGKVGIGTNTPGGLVEIADGAADPANYGSLQIVRPASPGNNLFHLSFIRAANAVFGMGFVNTVTPPNQTVGVWMANNTSVTPLMSFNQNQTVGINTIDTKGYQFAVNGSAIFTKAVVQLYANWADYVFNNDYKLMSIKSLEQYIYENKHLPDMPSAEEMQKKDGIDLGEMNTKLLQKVEELTLYVIELNKKIETLQNKISVEK